MRIKIDVVSTCAFLCMLLFTGVMFSIDCNPLGVRDYRGWSAAAVALIIAGGTGISLVAFVYSYIKNVIKNGILCGVLCLVFYCIFINIIKHLSYSCIH